ncbi:hypothetical protein B0H13DRAFT_1867546 [Mycena leptocephala]|nr:hypothetical protein B0H13DRAFT_1867546 [Mycena leptocephala]
MVGARSFPLHLTFLSLLGLLLKLSNSPISARIGAQIYPLHLTSFVGVMPSENILAHFISISWWFLYALFVRQWLCSRGLPNLNSKWFAVNFSPHPLLCTLRQPFSDPTNKKWRNRLQIMIQLNLRPNVSITYDTFIVKISNPVLFTGPCCIIGNGHSDKWWDRIAILNTSQMEQSLGLCEKVTTTAEAKTAAESKEDEDTQAVPRKRGRPPKPKAVGLELSTNGGVNGDNTKTEGNSVSIESVISPLFSLTTCVDREQELTWTLVSAVEDDEDMCRGLFSPSGSTKRNGGLPKKYYHRVLAQKCFAEHPTYRDAFKKAGDRQDP